MNLYEGCKTISDSNHTYICDSINRAGQKSRMIYENSKPNECELLNLYLINDMNTTLIVNENVTFGLLQPYCSVNIMITNKYLQVTTNTIVIDGINSKDNFITMAHNSRKEFCSDNIFNINGFAFKNWRMIFYFTHAYLENRYIIKLNNLSFTNSFSVTTSYVEEGNFSSDATIYINNCIFNDTKILKNEILYLPFNQSYIYNSTFSNSRGKSITSDSKYIRLENIIVFDNIYFANDTFFLQYNNGNSSVELNNIYYYNNDQNHIFFYKGYFNDGCYLKASNITISNNRFSSYEFNNTVFTTSRYRNNTATIYEYFNNITISNNTILHKETPLQFMILDSYGMVSIESSDIKHLQYLIKSNYSYVYINNSQVNVTKAIKHNSLNVNIIPFNSTLSTDIVYEDIVTLSNNPLSLNTKLIIILSISLSFIIILVMVLLYVNFKKSFKYKLQREVEMKPVQQTNPETQDIQINEVNIENQEIREDITSEHESDITFNQTNNSSLDLPAINKYIKETVFVEHPQDKDNFICIDEGYDSNTRIGDFGYNYRSSYINRNKIINDIINEIREGGKNSNNNNQVASRNYNNGNYGNDNEGSGSGKNSNYNNDEGGSGSGKNSNYNHDESGSGNNNNNNNNNHNSSRSYKNGNYGNENEASGSGKDSIYNHDESGSGSNNNGIENDANDHNLQSQSQSSNQKD